MNFLFLGFGIDENAGGIERYSNRILRWLGEQGHTVYICTLLKPVALPPGCISIPLTPWPRVDRYFLWIRLYRVIRKIRFCRIICGHLFFLKAADRCARMRGIKTDLFLYGIECWAGRFQKIVQGCSSVRYYFSISSFTTKQIIDQGADAAVIKYFPPLVDIIPEPKRHARSDNSFVLLTVGRLASNERYKGHDMVISALPIIRKAVPGIKYVIAGRGDDQPRLAALVTSVNIDSCVEFAGFVSEDKLKMLYVCADAFIMPSRVSLDPLKPEGEGFGIVFLEAALACLPLVGPDTGGSTDIITHEVNGLCVCPTDIQSIAEAVIRLADDRELRLSLGRNARRMVEERFSSTLLSQYAASLVVE